MKTNFSNYIIPGLTLLCVAAILPVVFGMRSHIEFKSEEEETAPRELQLPDGLEIQDKIPSMTEVLAKHLFVADRKPSGQNSYPDLMIKGVYIGEQCNAVFSLKSKPQINFRVWKGDEDAAFNLVEDDRDPRKPIVDFLQEWEIKAVGFGEVTLAHLLTGETETYTVDYTPTKKVADSAGAGYGQGLLVDNAAKTKKSGNKKLTSTAKSPTKLTPAGMPGMGGFMRQMDPEQRAMFIQRMRERMGSGSIGGGSRGDGDKSFKKSDKKNGGGGKKSKKKR